MRLEEWISDNGYPFRVQQKDLTFHSCFFTHITYITALNITRYESGHCFLCRSDVIKMCQQLSFVSARSIIILNIKNNIQSNVL